jgi:protein-tyrosine phosphatase
MFWDLHSHMVPSGDDGVRSEQEGLELCREAAERGTSVLFATPHVWPHFELSAERERAVREAHARMAPRTAVFGVDLRLGWELTPAPALLDQDLGRYRLGDLPAALMELPFDGPLGLAERLAEELEAAGLTPVIAHPERADAIQDEPWIAHEYAERGWLLQVNATSLLGAHGRRAEATGWRLVEDGSAAAMGSDGHRRARPPFLDAAYELSRARVGEERARALFGAEALRRIAEPLADASA